MMLRFIVIKRDQLSSKKCQIFHSSCRVKFRHSSDLTSYFCCTVTKYNVALVTKCFHKLKQTLILTFVNCSTT